MALIQLTGLKSSEKIMRMIFCLYLILYISEKFSSSLQRRIPTIGNLKAVSQFAIALTFAYLVVHTGSRVQDQTTSQLTILIPVIVYLLQEYTETTLSSGSSQENENLKNWMNSMYIFVFCALCLAINWYFYDPDKSFPSFLLTGLGISLYLFYTIYANTSANAGNTEKSFVLTKSTLNFPKTLTFFSVMLYFSIMCMKSLCVAAKPEQFNTKLYACAFAIPLIVGSFQIGSFVSDSIWALKRLFVTKLLTIVNLIDKNWTYHDICSEKLNNIVTGIISVQKSISTPGLDELKAWLTVDDPKMLESFGLTGTVPLDLFQELNAYFQIRNNRFDLGQFLGRFYKNTDPSKTSTLIYNNTGIWSCFTLGALTLVYMGTAVWTQKLKISSFLSALATAALVGFLVYLGYTFRTVSHASAARHEIYCEQYDLQGSECNASDYQYQQANFHLVNQINTIKAGSGVVSVNDSEIYDVKYGQNMTQLYNVLKTYPGQLSITDNIDAMVKAFNNLKSIAIETSLQFKSDASSINIYSASPDPVSANLDLTDITLQNLIDILTDARNFMQSLGVSAYVPDPQRAFVLDNAYFSVIQAPDDSNKTILLINFANKGQFFRQNVMDCFRVKQVVEEMIYGFSALGNNVNVTMNPMLLRNLYSSSQFDINANNHPYIDAVKASMRAILVKKLAIDLPAGDDLASFRFAQLTSPRSNWSSIKTFKTNGENEIISNLPSMSSQDVIVVKDFLMHAILPATSSKYDSTINMYLENLLWIVKLELLNDASPIMTDINYVENIVFRNLNIWTAVFVVAFVFCAFHSLKIGFTSDSYFNDYFQSSALGSKPSSAYNSLILLITLISLTLSVSIFTDIYRLEKASLANIVFTDSSFWGGKQSTIPLIISICTLLMFLPMYFPRLDNREHIYLVTFLLICTLCSPIVYTAQNTKKDTVLTARRFNGVAVIVVFALVSFLLITRDSSWLKTNHWNKGGVYLVLGVICLTCVSTPMMFLDLYQPEISKIEFNDKIKTVNNGVYIAICMYALLYIPFFVMMKRKKLFSNPIPTLRDI